MWYQPWGHVREGDLAADLNQDQLVNSDDFDTFVESFEELESLP